jgi:hypothetical protein
MIKKEFELMKTLIATPLLRRSLYAGMGAFRAFQRTIYAQYPDVSAVHTPEGFVDIALSKILTTLPEDLSREEKRVIDYLRSSLDTQ